MNAKLRVGIIGCGKISQTRHAPEYAENGDVEIAGFFDYVPERARQMAEQYGGEVFSSVEEIIMSDKIDAVSVCTSNSTHAEIAIAALSKGKHVLCEKPMAITEKECEGMLDAARRGGVRLAIAHNQRLNKVHRRAKELLKSGIIGRPICFKTCFGHSGPDNWSVDKGTGNWFFDRSKSAFGVIADLGIHKLDLIRYLLDSDVEIIQAMMGTLDKCDSKGDPVSVDDNAMITCRMKNGVMGTVEVSWSYYGSEDNSTVIYGDKGNMNISMADGTIDLQFSDGDSMNYFAKAQESTGVIDAFVDAVLRDGECVIDAEAVLPSMTALFAALESAGSGKRIYL